jgi:dipeptidase E
MRLYLSSFGLGNNPDELVRLVGPNNQRVAVIANASDYKNPEERKESLNRQMKDLGSLDFIPEEIDLRKYFNKKSELAEAISYFGMVWVKGGNTFILERAFEQSGFNKIIKKLLKEDKIVYAGYSAGICVIAPTLKGVELVDDPDIVPEGYKKNFSWQGMGLIDYNVAMHYRSNHPESAAVEKEVEYLKANNLPYKTLKDGEVIVIKGKTETIFTL